VLKATGARSTAALPDESRVADGQDLDMVCMPTGATVRSPPHGETEIEKNIGKLQKTSGITQGTVSKYCQRRTPLSMPQPLGHSMKSYLASKQSSSKSGSLHEKE